MLEENYNSELSICPKCGIAQPKKEKPRLNIDAIKIKLYQASESIEMALEVYNTEEDNNEFIHAMISCAKSYLFEADALVKQYHHHCNCP
jgi:hypothetical protein